MNGKPTHGVDAVTITVTVEVDGEAV